MATQEETVVLNFETNADEAADDMAKLREEADKMNTQFDKTKKGQDEFKQSLKDSSNDVRIFGVSMGAMRAAVAATVKTLKLSVTSLKAFRIALINTGLGAIIVLVGALVTAFAKSQAGIDLVNKALDAMTSVMDVLIQRIKLFAEGVALLFSGDFTAGFTKMGESFQGLATDIGEAATQAVRFQETLVELRREQVLINEAIGAFNALIEENKFKSEEANLSLERRIHFATQALLLEEVRSQREQEFHDKIVANLKERRDSFAKDSAEREEAQKNLSEATATQSQLLADSFGRRTSIRNSIRSLENEEKQAVADSEQTAKDNEAEETKRHAARLERRRQGLQQFQDLQTQETGILFQNLQSRFLLETMFNSRLLATKTEATAEFRKAQADADEASRVAEINARLDAEAGFYSTVAGFAGDLFGQTKGIAIVQAIISLQLAIAKAFEIGGPFGFALAAPIIAAFGNLIATVTAQQAPDEPTFDAPSMAKGGLINGRSHAAGGVPIEAEGGEFIINKKSMALNGVAEAAAYLNSISRPKFQTGGLIPQRNAQAIAIERALSAVNQTQAVLVVEDLTEVQTRVAVTEDLSTL